MILGAQLYSVRNTCDSDEGIRNTFHAMKILGYQSVQISGFSYDAQKARDAADEFGLHIGLTHTATQEIINNTDEVIKKHKILGADVVGIGSPGGYEKDGQIDIERFVAELTPAAEKLKTADLKLAYHNHFREYQNVPPVLDYLYEHTDWNFTFDVGWAHFAGADVCREIERFADRLEYVHLKDFRAPAFEGEGAGERITPILTGATPILEILTALEKAGTVKVAYVEQDNAPSFDSWEQMKISADNLHKKGWFN